MNAVIDTEQLKANISENIQRILAERNWSVRKLVERTGEPQNTVYRAVRGDNEPSAGLLAHIAEALNVSTDSLLANPKKRKNSA